MKQLLSLLVLGFALQTKAQLSSIDEDFSTFSGTTFPQNNWTSNRAYPYAYFVANSNPQIYSLFDSTTPTYVITPEIVSPDGSKTLTFDAQITTNSNGGGSIQVGVLTDASDIATFVAISTAETLQATSTTYSYTVPASSGKYIAFKFQPTTIHAALQFDNVKYSEQLAVTESTSNKDVKFALTADNSALKFVSTSTLSNAKVYSAAGQLATEGKIINNTFDIARLRTGVYYIVIEKANGQSVKSKFIKNN